eukprot:6205310-Pleurochrysis_carterae.AAC.5
MANGGGDSAGHEAGGGRDAGRMQGRGMGDGSNCWLGVLAQLKCLDPVQAAPSPVDHGGGDTWLHGKSMG